MFTTNFVANWTAQRQRLQASCNAPFFTPCFVHSLLRHASTSVFKLGLSNEDADDDDMEDFPRCPSHEGPQDMTLPRPTHDPLQRARQ
jgi:hypothetical protein